MKVCDPSSSEILSTNKKKNVGTLSHVKLPNISPEIFSNNFNFIYRCIVLGIFMVEELEYDAPDIIKILFAATELSLQELIPYLQSFLIKNKTNRMEQNFKKIFNSPDFTSISEKSLISPLRHDNLQISEVHSNYSNDDFNALKNTLQQCIPFIKFMEFTSKEFLRKVCPYKKVILKELQICDGQSRTVTIIKVGGSSKILGGNSIENYILSNVEDETHAIYNGGSLMRMTCIYTTLFAN
ncbi:hypothetical protein C1645_836218 [Glomus cerebriforme]|uniref:BACK domain-containing protein n=1 Tax=Glomus cerebriforme TaxID=658196 RepID=A0A397SD18_9GLOM|nr:hypothetical protein C1645_836218 [Glomus cerebriforme]